MNNITLDTKDILILSILILSFFYSLYFDKTFAESPSFITQEIADSNADSTFKPGTNHLCNTIDEFIKPAEIDSVKYYSNGKEITSRIYLSKPLYDPNQIAEFIKIPETKITTSILLSEIEENSSLLDYLNIKLTHNSTHQQNPRSGEYNMESYKIGGSKAGYETVYYKIGNKLLTFNYQAPLFEYASYHSGFKKVINNVIYKLSNITAYKKTLDFINETLFIDSFDLKKLRLNWNNLQNSFNQVSFSFYPFNYQYQYYTMNIDIKSIFDPGSDYKLKYGREIYRGNNQWYRSLYEVSSDQQGILITNNPVDPFLNSSGMNYFPLELDPFSNSSGMNYFPLELDLGLLHYPSEYNVNIIFEFGIRGFVNGTEISCDKFDTLQWLSVPPPNMDISLSKYSVNLRPGETEDIKLKIKNDANLQTTIIPKVLDSKDLVLKFEHPKISIPKSTNGTLTFSVTAPDTSQKKTVTVPIVSQIEFPQNETIYGSKSKENVKLQPPITLTEYLTVTTLSHFTFDEQLANFVEKYITPVNSLWTFFIGVAAVLSPKIIQAIRRLLSSKSKKDDLEVEDSK